MCKVDSWAQVETIARGAGAAEVVQPEVREAVGLVWKFEESVREGGKAVRGSSEGG